VSRPSALALAVAALAFAGCGAKSEPAAAPAPQATVTTVPAAPSLPSKEAFIQSADRRCRHTNGRLKPIVERIIRLDLSTQPIAYRLSGYRDAFHDLGIEFEDLVAELQQLEVPRRDHRLVTRMMRLMDVIPLHLDRVQAAITDLDVVSLFRTEVKLNQTFVRLGGTADSYGFGVCGVVPGRHPHGDEGPFPGAKNV
jgi:hypothetical protein